MKYYARERRLRCDFFFLSLNNRFFLLQFISKEINVTLYFFFFKKKNLSNLSSITHTHIRTSLKFYSKSKIQRKSRITKVFNLTLSPVFIVQRERDNEPLKIPSFPLSLYLETTFDISRRTRRLNLLRFPSRLALNTSSLRYLEHGTFINGWPSLSDC